MGKTQAIASSVQTAQSLQGKLDSSLVGYWAFDGRDYPLSSANNACPSNNGCIIDRSGNANPAEIYGYAATSSAEASGVIGQGLAFDDNAHAGALAFRSGLPTTAITVSFWLKQLTNWQNGNDMFDFYSSTTTALAIANASANRLGIFINNQSQFNSTAALTIGKWYHIVLTRTSGGVQTLYINGAQDSTFTDGYTLIDPGTCVGFGIDPTNPNTGCDIVSSAQTTGGVLDDVRIYNRALSTTEISQLYAMGKTQAIASSVQTTQSLQGKLDSSLVGYWAFDGKDYPLSCTTGCTTNIIDRSGNGRSALLFNYTSTSTAQVSGTIGQALNLLQGSPSTGAEIPGLAVPTGDFTYTFWIYNADPTPNNNSDTILYAQDASANQEIYLTYNDNANPATITIVVGGTAGALQGIPLKKWTFVALSRSGTTVTFQTKYPGTSNSNTFTAAGTLTSTSQCGLWIGAINTNTSCLAANVANGTLGRIDDVRVYNRALSTTEINQLYAMGITPAHN